MKQAGRTDYTQNTKSTGKAKRINGNNRKAGSDIRKADSGAGKADRAVKGADIGEKCPVAQKCGGCQYSGVPYKEQLTRKQQRAEMLLGRFGRVQKIIGMEEPMHYRNKVHAVFDFRKKQGIISGIYREGTHEVIPVDRCVLEDVKADEIIVSVRELAKSFKLKTYNEDTGVGLLRHVLVRVGHETGQIMVVLVLGTPIFPSKKNFVKELCKLHPEITTIVLNVNDRQTSMVLGEKEQVLYGKGYIEDVLCGRTFRISAKSFYQVNAVQTGKLYTKAMAYAGLTGRETVIDAYCGIGTISLVAAERANRVIGVELNRAAVKDAVVNAKVNGIDNADFYQNDAGRFMVQLAQAKEKADVVFMDPPRSGSTREFMDALLMLAPERIVYISCNPETLARDLAYLTGVEREQERPGIAKEKSMGMAKTADRLNVVATAKKTKTGKTGRTVNSKKTAGTGGGYRVEEMTPVDMFPYTDDIEVVCLLSKLNAERHI